ncbi:hypothetical protein MC885_000877 [Smutsia gigantea]|nr:hypothetical protein MC885_000877 [Smutsia gigantea]
MEEWDFTLIPCPLLFEFCGVCKLIDLRYPPPAKEGAVASRVPAAGAGTTAPREVPHAQQTESRRCVLLPELFRSEILFWPGGSRTGDFGALGVGWAASWGPDEPVASCPLRLGPESRLFRTALRQEEGWKPRPRKSFEENLAPEECFSPLDLFNKVQEQNEELGLIIDLTYTHRYYKPEDLPETVPYLKIYTIGHQVPDDDAIFKFKYAVNGFLKENKNNVVRYKGKDEKSQDLRVYKRDNKRQTYWNSLYPWCKQDWLPHLQFIHASVFNRCRGHCLERQNYIEDLQSGPIRKNWESSVSRSSGFEDTTHLMEPVHTTHKSVNQGPRYNLRQTQGYRTPSRHFHIQNQDLQLSIRKFSPYQDVYQRDRIPPPGPPGGDYSQRRYSWNVKPNASQATQNKRWSSGSYCRLSYPTYGGWTE